MIKILRDTDIGYTHLETLMHDYDEAEVYPAAAAGGTWMRSPRFVADELKWAGFNMASHASNHALDYSYGGLISIRGRPWMRQGWPVPARDGT